MKPLLLDEIKRVMRAEARTELGREPVTGVRIDSRQVVKGDLFFAIRGENFDGHDFVDQAVRAGGRAVVVDRNMPVSTAVKETGTTVLKVDDSTEALGKLAKFYRESLAYSLTVIAVTGSNGKTTTRSLIYHVLSKKHKGHQSPRNFNNNIGVPLTLLGVEPTDSFAVVEIGTNTPGEVAYLSGICEPDIAVITHVGPAHLEGLGDIEGVSVEKVSIAAGLKERGVLVCGMGHEATLERVRALGRPLITFGVEDGADVGATKVEQRHGSVKFLTNDRCEVTLPLAGVHNVNNALAALAAVRRLGVSSKEFAAALTDYVPVAGRMVYHNFNGITVIDDTYNANPASMEAALAELLSHGGAGRRIFICGDMGELGEKSEEYHCEFGKRVARSSVDVFMTVGPLAAGAANAALEAGMGRGDVQRAVSSKRLARLVKASIRSGDVIVVKGSRAMAMEKVVESLSRFKAAR